MKHAALLVALMCLTLLSPAFAADSDIPWFLPFFSKNQHLYICGPVEEYGLTQQQVSELEKDLDHLSCVCDTNLYFSISCSSDPDTKTHLAYTNLLVERWMRNDLPTEKRAVFALTTDHHLTREEQTFVIVLGLLVAAAIIGGFVTYARRFTGRRAW